MATILHNDQEISVVGEFSEQAVSSPLLTSWLARISSEFAISQIEVQSLDIIRGAVRFIKIKVTVLNGSHSHDMVVFLRGNAVVVLPVFIFNSERYVLLVKQKRLPVGSEIYELIAGMMDDVSDPKEVALREMQEEATLASLVGITEADLHPLFDDRAISSSPGILDESVYPFYCEKEISDPLVFEKLKGIHAGLEEENEHIVTHLVPYRDVLGYCSDAKTLATLYLYEQKNT